VISSSLLPPAPVTSGEGRVRFGSSRFKLVHKAQMAMWDELKWKEMEEYEHCNEMLRALKELVTKYASAKDMIWMHSDGAKGQGRLFFDALVSVAQKETRPHYMCERLWTSPEELNLPGGTTRALFQIINEVVREDDHSYQADGAPSLLLPATTLVCMLQYHLNAGRRTTKGHTKWPDGQNGDTRDTVFRGSGLPAEHQAFFRSLAGEDRWYRVPHPLASSFRTAKAYEFMGYQPGTMPKAEWTIKFDPTKRCPHVNYVEKTEVPGEEEFLFSAYSAFKVIEFRPPTSGDGTDRDDPFRITLEAHHDNTKVAEDVPCSPWH
jgi:hypothetical protein